MYLFGCTGSSLPHRLFSSCGEQGLPCSCGALASHSGGCSCWGAPRWGGWYLQSTTWRRDVQMHRERIPLHLVNDHIHHLTYSFLFRVRTFKFYSLSKLQVGNTVLSVVVTTFHIRSSSLAIPVTASLYPFTRLSYFPHLLRPDMAPHSSTLAWKIPWTEDPGGLQSMGSLRVGYDWATSLSPFTFMRWRRKWQPTHSSVLAWRIPGTGEPGGLLSMGSHRGGHNWRDLAAAMPDNHFLILCFYGFNLFSRFHT